MKWKQVLVQPQMTIREMIQKLDSVGLQIILVVDEEQKLLGTVTDGDVRRGILKGIALDAPVSLIMNPQPKVAMENEDREKILAKMKKQGLRHIPIVDVNHKVLGLDLLEELIQPQKKINRVVLMAGGLGSRLGNLTADCPKPMLKVGDKPIMENILLNLIEHGFERFYISVNHMADVVKNHFKDGSKWNVEIIYLEENQKLGTAGALSLIREPQVAPLLIVNGDLLTKVNFSHLVEFHEHIAAEATMCVREYDFQVPYGVVRINDHLITGIDEKPVQKFFVNAGIYFIEPSVLRLLPRNTHLDMPQLFEKLIAQGLETAVFPIREYWLDIGQIADYNRAKLDFSKEFHD